MEDANSQPPLGLAPLDTQTKDGAEPSSETGQPAASEETVHPEGETPEGDAKKEESAEGEKPTEENFYEEGGKTFKTKEDYFTHVNQQRAAASRLAHEKKLTEERVTHLEKLYAGALEAVGKTSPAKADEPEINEETRQAMQVLKQNGFLTKDMVESMFEEKIKPFKADSERRLQEEFQTARQSVDEFIGLNPDVADHAVQLEDTLLRMERAGVPGGLEQAYYLVTGRLPKTQDGAAAEEKREMKQVKAAQAGGAPANKSGGPGKERDVFDTIIGSSGPSLL